MGPRRQRRSEDAERRVAGVAFGHLQPDNLSAETATLLALELYREDEVSARSASILACTVSTLSVSMPSEYTMPVVRAASVAPPNRTRRTGEDRLRKINHLQAALRVTKNLEEGHLDAGVRHGPTFGRLDSTRTPGFHTGDWYPACFHACGCWLFQ